MTEERVELEPHPIRDKVAHLLKDGTDEPAVFDASAVQELSTIVDAYVDQKDHELQEVVRTLISIYEWLRDEQGAPNAADALKSAFKTGRVIKRVLEIENEMRANEAEDASQKGTKLGAFTGQQSDKKAPKLGDQAPKGSLKLGDLSFPKKM